MSDLISRQAAIDDIKAIYEYHDTVTEERIIDHLKRLPSAPTVDAVEVVRCEDCKHRHKVNAYQWCDIDPERDVEVDDEHYCSYGVRKTEPPQKSCATCKHALGDWDGERSEQMSKELNCMNCCIGDFKHNLCDCDNGFCKEFKSIGKEEDFFNAVMQRIRPQGEWIFHSEWEEHWCRYECSLCGRTFDYEMNYCGFCGARMLAKDINVPNKEEQTEREGE